MTRGLMKSASIFALGMALSVSANAADLGGNCCADLEERVAELEATTARKGTRKTSLTIYGWVNKTIMSWDAPTIAGQPSRGTYLGVDNTNTATRFGFRGDAAINSEWKAGYSMLWDVASGARTSTASRTNEEGAINNSTFGLDDNIIRMRDGNVWLESGRLGRTTMGRLTGTGAVGTIDLGGTGVVAPGTVLSGNGLTFSNGTTLSNVTDLAADYGYRVDGLRWDSPTWAGFVLSASIGETSKKNGRFVGDESQGRVEGVQLRYAGEFNGVRIAAGIGSERADDLGNFDYQTTSLGNPNPIVTSTSAPAGTTARNTGGSLSLMHTATGLFIQGSALRLERESDGFGGSDGYPGAFPGVAGLSTWKNDIRILQAGLTRNFFGIGNTVLYGEYHRYDLSATNAFAGLAGKTDIWGLGVVQNIDAAAMQLYAGYRNHNHVTVGGVDRGDIGIFLAGARINF